MHHFHHGVNRKLKDGEMYMGFPQRLIPLCIYCHNDVHFSLSKKFLERHGRPRGDFLYLRDSQPVGIPDASTIPPVVKGW
jgi:hypothetical protein